MKYLYETHTHTKEASACASCTAEESVWAHKKAGYTGIILTNHFFYGNTAVYRKLPWDVWVHEFCRPYEHAKKEGKKAGLQVFFGWEAGYDGTEFLVYGLDEEWLISHPQIKDASIEEQYNMVKESGGMVIHPHPFREEFYIPEIRLYPEYVDGVEAYNAMHCSPDGGTHWNPEFDVKARNYSEQYHLPVTAGSDTHSVELLGGGMVFGRKLKDINDFIKAVKGREALDYLDGTKKFQEEA